MKEQHPAIRLLRALYQQTPGGFVELRAISTDVNAKPRRIFTTTPKVITDFIDQYGQKGGDYSVYFGVNKRERESGKKVDVERVSALYVDVDTVKNGWDTDAMVKRIHAMKGVLRPSACVKSGGGLHLYWFVETFLAAHHTLRSSVEDVNVKLRDIFAGDAVQNIDRILRLPGTYNHRRKAKVELVWCYEFERSMVGQVANAAHNFRQCIGDDGEWTDRAKQKNKDAKVQAVDPMDRFIAAYTDGKRTALKNIEKLWAERVRYHAPRGYIGIHEAALAHTAQLHIADPDMAEAGVVKVVMEQIKRIKDRDAPDETWDMAKESKTVAEMYRTWQPKWRQYVNERKREQAAERKKNGGTASVRQRR